MPISCKSIFLYKTICLAVTYTFLAYAQLCNQVVGHEADLSDGEQVWGQEQGRNAHLRISLAHRRRTATLAGAERQGERALPSHRTRRTVSYVFQSVVSN